MKYEVEYGNITRWYDAATPMQACLFALEEHVNEFDTVAVEPFGVKNLSTGEEEIVDLQLIVFLRNESAHYDPNEVLPEPELDPLSDLGFEILMS
jgi:hypothetical protein